MIMLYDVVDCRHSKSTLHSMLVIEYNGHMVSRSSKRPGPGPGAELEHMARITTFIIVFISIFCGWPCYSVFAFPLANGLKEPQDFLAKVRTPPPTRSAQACAQSMLHLRHRCSRPHRAKGSAGGDHRHRPASTQARARARTLTREYARTHRHGLAST